MWREPLAGNTGEDLEPHKPVHETTPQTTRAQPYSIATVATVAEAPARLNIFSCLRGGLRGYRGFKKNNNIYY